MYVLLHLKDNLKMWGTKVYSILLLYRVQNGGVSGVWGTMIKQVLLMDRYATDDGLRYGNSICQLCAYESGTLMMID